jgi:ATP:ADP antiporter, AAA family
MSATMQRLLNVRRDEVAPVLMAVFYFFCILTALQVLRPAREALGLERGIEAIRWLFQGTLIITLFVNPVFAWLVSRFRRMVFISTTYLFFVANLIVFYILLVFAPTAIGQTSGQVFYVWMSVFNLFITMVFWALMADRFAYEQSKRVFGLIAVGGTLGAITGSAMAAVLAERIGTPMLLLIAAGFLTLAVVSAWMVTRLTAKWNEGSTDTLAAAAAGERTIIGGTAWQGFSAVSRSPYLMAIAAYILILAVLVTFVYFTRLQMVAALGEDTDMRTGVFARIDLITQVATLVLQAIVAGHLMRRLGVAVTLAITPVIVALGFIGLAIIGSLAALVIFDATFRATQRALMRPARETLFTVVTRESKYKAKAFTDTFVYRAGDSVGAGVEGLLGRFGMALVGLASVAVPLALGWAALGVWLGRRQSRLDADPDQDPAATRRQTVAA